LQCARRSSESARGANVAQGTGWYGVGLYGVRLHYAGTSSILLVRNIQFAWDQWKRVTIASGFDVDYFGVHPTHSQKGAAKTVQQMHHYPCFRVQNM
jgi:hypothetical protein